MRTCLWGVLVVASSCGGGGPWTCDTTGVVPIGMAVSRNAATNAVVGCSSKYSCSNGEMSVACSPSGSAWLCQCSKDGFQQGSFTNDDICSIAATQPSADGIPAWGQSLRNRINTGCLWKLPAVN